MHFELLVEDVSGKRALDILVPKLLGKGDTFKVHSYKGIGRLPAGLRPNADPRTRILLDQLPRLLRGYGHQYVSSNFEAIVVVVCDLDAKDLKTFHQQLLDVVEACTPKPTVCFCFAIEEGEAWLLGDLAAIEAAYPNAKRAVLSKYKNDSICGTWEVLANALYQGGAAALLKKGWAAVGAEKSAWAQSIAPHMKIDNNMSPSFMYFCARIKEFSS